MSGRPKRSGFKFKVVLEPAEEGGFTALVPSLPGCISEGDSVQDALANIQEAIELYLEPDEASLHKPNTKVYEVAV